MRSLLGIVLLGALAVGGCGTAPVDKYVEIAPATIHPGDPIPPASGDVVLAVSGAIAGGAGATPIELDLATIEQMGLVRYVVHDPWLDEDLEFSGVLLTTLLDVMGASPEATTLGFTAIDDYQVEIAIADARRWPIMLATQTNGQPMDLEAKGPTRVVFPYDQYPEIDRLVYKDLWIWQLTTVEVR